ncbi:MAG: TolC family protein [Candidatus Marinimicrobia bacterium]|nr:TolC family protein [Candidatus Neomarinimicrobiota bacterium]
MKSRILLMLISICMVMILSGETLNLEQCIDIARKGNPALQQSRIDTEIGQSRVRQAYSPLMPNVSVSSGISSSNQSSWDLGKSVGLNAGMTFYSPGMYSGIKSSRMSADVSRALRESTENDVITRISSLYYRILSTQKLIRVYEANISTAEENIKKTRAMYDMNVITESDVLKAEAQKGDFESRLLNQKQLYASYIHSMNILLGREPDAALKLMDVDVESTRIPEYTNARNVMLEQNPDYRVVRLQKDMGEVLLNASRETYLPSVSGNYNYSNTLEPSVDPVNSVSLSASWTLFNGLSRRENVQQRKLQLRQTEIELNNMVRVLEQQLRDLYTQFETYSEMIDINRRRLVSAQRDFEIVDQQYRLGEVTMLERMQAQVAVLSAESSLVEAQYSRKAVEYEILKLINKI